MSNSNHQPARGASGDESLWDDSRITAYVLGELDSDEREQFQQQIDTNPALAKAVEQARDVTGQLATYFESVSLEPLDPQRREEILSQSTSATNAPASSLTLANSDDMTEVAPASAPRSRPRWLMPLIAASTIFVLAGLTWPMIQGTRELASQIKPTEVATPQPSASSSKDSEPFGNALPESAKTLVLDEDVVSTDSAARLDQISSTAPAPFDVSESHSTQDKRLKEPLFAKQPGATTSPSEPAGELVPSLPGFGGPAAPARQARPKSNLAKAESSSSDGMELSLESERGRGIVMKRNGLKKSELLEAESLSVSAPPIVVSPADPSSRDRYAAGAAMQPAQPASPLAARKSRSRGGDIQSANTRRARGRRPGMMDMGMDMGMGAETMDMEIVWPNSDASEGKGPGMPGDKFDPIVENEFQRADEHPLSTFSIDVDTASYSKVRDFLLRSHQLPRADAVRIEELVNYFEYDYKGPLVETKDANEEADSNEENADELTNMPFGANMAVASCPWEPNHRLVRIGIQAAQLNKKERPQCNLVFLIDTSGSMRSARKLPLVIDGMKVLLNELRKDDRVAIVVYAGSAGLVLDSTPVKKKKKILQALTALQAGGSTNGGAGLQLAYDTAREHFIQGGVNRVILCSDGDFNVGMTGTDQLVREAKQQAKSGTELTVLGFGMGNHNDAMMERISNSGAGNYAFVDSITEARKVLVDQLSGTLVTVAKDVKIQVDFNPAVVSAHRLIGYVNRKLAKEDFNDDRKDAGEIGAGHRVTALYEIAPAGKLPASVPPPVDPSEFAVPKKQPKKQEAVKMNQDLILKLRLRYKPPQGDTSTLKIIPLANEDEAFEESDVDFRFASAVAAFGMQLRGSEFAGSWTYDDVLRVAQSAIGTDAHGLRAEFVQMVQAARALTVNERRER